MISQLEWLKRQLESMKIVAISVESQVLHSEIIKRNFRAWLEKPYPSYLENPSDFIEQALLAVEDLINYDKR